MHKTFLFVLMLAAAMFFTGCNKEVTPAAAAKSWMQALLNDDHAAANEYSITEVHFINASALENFKKNPDAKAKLREEINKIDSYKVVIEGDSAKLFAPGEKNTPLLMKKINGKWRVAYQTTL